MLPTMLPSLKTTFVAAVTALSVALSTAAPAHAWGKNEQNFLKGVAATVIVGALLKDAQRRNQPAPQPRYEEHYQPRHQPRYEEEHRTTGRVVGTNGSVYRTTAAQAFNAYGHQERRAIQSRLRSYGYYTGGIDGAFGPGTYRAIVAYARDAGGEGQLRNRAGAFGIYDSLIY